MALLTVTGGPTAPAGRTLTTGTTLRVVLAGPYHDGTLLHAREHQADLDPSTGGWKPAGAANGTPFLLPGAAAGEPIPPVAAVTEVQAYADGGGQTIQRAPALVRETSEGAWWYGSLDRPLLAGNTVGLAGTTVGFAGAPTWPYGAGVT